MSFLEGASKLKKDTDHLNAIISKDMDEISAKVSREVKELDHLKSYKEIEKFIREVDKIVKDI